MRYLILVTVLWAFSFSLIGQYLAGRVDSDFAVLVRVSIAAAVFIPFTRWRGLPLRLLGMLIFSLSGLTSRLLTSTGPITPFDTLLVKVSI